MARARDNADLLSGGKTIEMESGKISGLSVVNALGKEIFNIRESGEIYQEYTDKVDLANSGVLLLSENGGVRVTLNGALEITNDGGNNWHQCCFALDTGGDGGDGGLIPVKDYSFDGSFESSKLIASDVYGHFYINPTTKKLFTCGMQNSKYNATCNHLSISPSIYATIGSDYKDRFSEIYVSGELPEDYKAKMVRTAVGKSNVTFMILDDGRMYSIGGSGYNSQHRGLSDGGSSNPQWEQESNKFNNWIYVETCSSETYAIRSDGSLWKTTIHVGPGYKGSSFKNTESWKVKEPGPWKMISIASGSNFVYAVKQDGTLWSWLTRYPNVKKIGTEQNWDYVSCGYAHAVALNKKGELWGIGKHCSSHPKTTFYSCMGSGASAISNATRLFRMGDENNWIFCDASYEKTSAIRRDGTIHNTGINTYFELGLGGRDRDGYGYKTSNFRATTKSRSLYPVGYLSSVGNFQQEVSLRSDWLTVCGTDNSLLALTDEFILHASGTNNVGPRRYSSFPTLKGSKIGIHKSDKTMDIFYPVVYGESEYPSGAIIPAPKPPARPPVIKPPPTATPTPPTPPSRPTGPRYNCTWAGPASHPPVDSDCYKKAHGISTTPTTGIRYNCTWAGPASHPPTTSSCYKKAHGLA